jgi:DNA-binding NarL/FixJ family response regulator
MTSHDQILIAARPGIMRNSLLAYIRAIPRVRAIEVADDADSALRTIQASPPKLVIVDADLNERDMLLLVRWVCAEQPKTKLILLVESIRQQDKSLALGAHFALLKGFLDKPLRDAVVQAMGEAEPA